MEDSIEKGGKRSYLSCILARWKQILASIVVIAAIVLLLVDFITQSCTVVEKEADRRIRLFCDDALLVDENGTLLAGQPFICSNNSAPNPTWTSNDAGDNCIRKGLCSEVAINVFLDWFSENTVIGFFATSLAYGIATMLLMPGSLLTISAGVAFGAAYDFWFALLLGTISVWLGASAGAAISFILGRYLLREYAMSLTTKFKSFRAVDHVLGTRGFEIILLLRLSPVVPFAWFNYLAGATACSFRDYLFGTLLGIIPGSAVYVFLGISIAVVAQTAMSAGGEEASDVFTDDLCESQDNTIQIVILVVGLLATIIALFQIVRYARKQYVYLIDEEIEREAEEDKRNSQKHPVIGL